MKEYKIVVVGNGGVGKSALTVRFVQGQFVSSYDATIEDSYRKYANLDGEDCRMEILDTAGTEQFSGMRDLYVRNGNGFILVYSIDDPHSYDSIETMAQNILRIKERTVPLVIVGNKSDLSPQYREISTAKGYEMAKKFNCPFWETSAKTNANVQEIFYSCARQIRNSPCKQKPKKKMTIRNNNNNNNQKYCTKKQLSKQCCTIM